LRLRRLAVGGLVVLLRRRCRLLRCRLHALVRGPALLDAAAWLCRRIAVDWSLAVANRGAPQERGNGWHYQVTGAQGCLRQIGLGALRVRQPSIVNCIYERIDGLRLDLSARRIITPRPASARSRVQVPLASITAS
jgi:hypothetical protein